MGGPEGKIVQGHDADGVSRMSSEEHRAVGRSRDCVLAVKKALFPATLESIFEMIEFVERGLEGLGCPPSVQTMFSLMTDEIASNIAKYAYGSLTGDVMICLSALQDGSVLEVSFIDGGIAFNPLDAPTVTIEESIASGRHGGRGIMIVKKIANEIEYERDNEKNILRIRMRIER